MKDLDGGDEDSWRVIKPIRKWRWVSTEFLINECKENDFFL
jgi:hypothetical protein